jgi:ABC-type branched-subunit amino acid transport system ATPase component/branched-subunit amino acid ABC-type transport system permease component
VSQHAVFLLLGLANGAVFASLALALVVTFRSSGVINFATGAIALVTAYMYAFLRNGELLLLVPGLPKSIHLGGPLAFAPAAATSIAAAAVLGLALYGLIFRPLRAAPAVAKAVASVGVMVVLTGVIQLRMGTTPVHVDRIFPTTVYRFGSVQVSADRFWFAVTVLGVALILGAMYRFTRFGLHTRAAAETEKGAYVSGISPDRVAAVNWMISAGLAGLAGILIAPITPLVPYSYTLFIVPALAAAIVGGFQRLGAAVAAGLAIGMIQSEMVFLRTQHTWLPASGLAELVPLVLILVVLVARAKPLPSRGGLLQDPLGSAPRPRRTALPAVCFTGLGLVAVLVLQGSWREALVTSFIFGIISLSLVVVTGYAGQVSLAQLTLAGVGGFLVASLSSAWGVPFPLAPLLAALGATVIGVVVGLPALRIRGLPVAVVTLSLAVALQALWFRNNDFVGSGGKDVRSPSLLGLDLGPGSGAAYPRPAFCIMVLAVFVAVAVAVARLRMSRLGGAMLAVRANERSAAAAGIDVVRTKLAAFAIGAFIAGLGGSLLGYKLGNVTWDSFDVLLGLGLFATVYVAGITSVSGGVLAGLIGFGGLVFYASEQWLAFDSNWYQVVTGIALVLSVVANPEGLVGPVNAALGRRRGRSEEPAPSPTRPPAPIAVAPVPVGTGALLSVEHLGVRYGGVLALDEVSFDVPEHAIVGLIGPNGAGKTTLIDAVSGFCAHRGTVHLGGTALDGQPPHRRVRSGLGRTFQGVELWGDLSVEENITVGYGAAGRSADELDALFDLLGLEPHRDRMAGELAQGQRKLVSIARSLVGLPKVLLLDEPAAGLDPSESAWLADRLRLVRESGVTIVLVDHDMDLVLGLCDHVEVLDFGRLIASGDPDAIRRNRDVLDAYLGATPAPQPARPR